MTLAVLLAGTLTQYQAPSRLDDLHAYALRLLNKLDGIKYIERLVPAYRPQYRIIHIADWHAVLFDALAADLRDQEPTITVGEIQAEYRATMAAVEAVQSSQRKLIRQLAKEHGVRRVFLEGLSDADLPAYLAIVEALAKYGPDAIPPEYGAVAQLLVAGDLEGVAAAEDEAAYEQANPLAGDSVVLDGPANDAREAAIVRRLIDSGPLSVIVLGGAHDLSEHVRAVGDCEYLRVFVEGYPR